MDETITGAIKDYVKDVKERKFPSQEHKYPMDEKEKKLFEEYLLANFQKKNRN